ncbi:MAG: hypothetical protein IAF08_14945 [Rhizobacter sp.]|nr:hypothetical protein [Chlorobiales bacterium]
MKTMRKFRVIGLFMMVIGIGYAQGGCTGMGSGMGGGARPAGGSQVCSCGLSLGHGGSHYSRSAMPSPISSPMQRMIEYNKQKAQQEEDLDVPVQRISPR